jgi:hypothetical protein
MTERAPLDRRSFLVGAATLAADIPASAVRAMADRGGNLVRLFGAAWS